MTFFTFTTPYPPSANHYKKPVIRRLSGGRVQIRHYVDGVAEQFRKEVAWIAKAAGVREITGRVALEIKLYPKRPQDWASRQRKRPDSWDDSVQCIDVGNAEKCISDALNGIAWADDKQVWDLRVLRMTPDAQGARCEVTIRPIVADRPLWEFEPAALAPEAMAL